VEEGLSFVHIRKDRSSHLVKGGKEKKTGRPIIHPHTRRPELLRARLAVGNAPKNGSRRPQGTLFFFKKNYLILFFKSSFYFNFCFIFPKLCCLISFPTDLLIYVSEFLKSWLFRTSEMLTLENF